MRLGFNFIFVFLLIVFELKAFAHDSPGHASENHQREEAGRFFLAITGKEATSQNLLEFIEKEQETSVLLIALNVIIYDDSLKGQISSDVLMMCLAKTLDGQVANKVGLLLLERGDPAGASILKGLLLGESNSDMIRLEACRSLNKHGNPFGFGFLSKSFGSFSGPEHEYSIQILAEFASDKSNEQIDTLINEFDDVDLRKFKEYLRAIKSASKHSHD